MSSSYEYNKQYRLDNIAAINANRRVKYAQRRKEVDDIKLSRGCMDCGYNTHPAALDFDHRPGTDKVCNVARLTEAAREVLYAEIAKCDVVCANCHRIRTWDPKGRGRA